MAFSDVSGSQRERRREMDEISPAPARARYYPRGRDYEVDIAWASTQATEDEDNPVVCGSCTKWSSLRLPLMGLSVIPGMVVYSVLGGLIGVLILPILQWNFLTGFNVDAFRSVDAMILTLRRLQPQQSGNNRTTTVGQTTNLSLLGRLQSMCNGNNHMIFTNVCVFIVLVALIIVYYILYILVVIIMILTTMAIGGVMGIYVGIVLGCDVSFRVTDRLMKGEMKTDTLYRLTEARLVKYGFLKVIVHTPTARQTVRQLDGCLLFYGLLGLCGPFLMLSPGGDMFFVLSIFVSTPGFNVVLVLYLFFIPFMVYNVHNKYVTKLAKIEQEFIELAPTCDEEEAAQGGEEELQEWIDKYNEMLEIAQNFQNVPLTEEEENWVRFAYLLVDEGTIWVKGLFIANIQEKGNTLQVLLETNRNMLKKKAGMNSSQLRLMFPTPTEVTDSADEFDLTLLVRLIGILNLSPKPDAKDGWKSDTEPTNPDPETYNHSLIPLNKKIHANNLLRMRLMRNRLYAHVVDCKMTKEEFDVEFPKVKDILVSFGATVEKIDEDFKKLNMTPESRKHFAQRVTTLFSGDHHDVERLMEKTIANHKGIHQHDEDHMNEQVPEGAKTYRQGIDGKYVLINNP